MLLNGIVAALILWSATAWAQTDFDPKYERDYNIFTPADRYRFDNPLNPANRYRSDNPLNPANKYNFDAPFAPLRGASEQER